MKALFFGLLISTSVLADFYSYTPKECPVVGNTKSYIYHVPGGSFYSMMLQKNKKGDNRKCFFSESEAIQNGFRKSKR